MTDITAIILTKNEEVNIERCIKSLNGVVDRICVVDSGSTDHTIEIAKNLGAEIFNHAPFNHYAAQFNWALDNLKIETAWILRLDADEYLLPELVAELREKLPAMPENVSALSLSRARTFYGKILHHGIVNDVKIVRIFRRGRARYEKRLMDEHLSILSGRTIEMTHQFVDDNRIPIGQFIEKHNGYATREAALLLDAEYQLTDVGQLPKDHGEEVEKKRAQKAKYARMPLFWRAFGYFIYRYILKMGFLDGKEGFLWDFLQGWWYRTLVDAKIFEIKKACGDDKEKIRAYLDTVYHIKL